MKKILILAVILTLVWAGYRYFKNNLKTNLALNSRVQAIADKVENLRVFSIETVKKLKDEPSLLKDFSKIEPKARTTRRTPTMR